MQRCVLVPFETTEKKFLRLISEQLEILKTCGQKAEFTLDTLSSLCLDYIDILPKHFYELIYLIKDIINNYLYFEHMEKELQIEIGRSLLLCKLLQEKPSSNLFFRFVQNQFETIYEYDTFPEEIIFSIISSLSSSLISKPNLNSYSEKRLYWLALSNMTLSKKCLLALVKSFSLNGDDFVNFCKDVAVSQNADEEILLLLIGRIENKRISINSKKNSSLKYELYATIFECANPTENVIREILKVIVPDNEDYFNFFHMVIDRFKRNKELLNIIISRLKKDETQKNENMKVYVRRLILLATNV